MKAFDGYHPTVLLVYFCSVLLVAMFVTNPIIQLSALLGGILTAVFGVLGFVAIRNGNSIAGILASVVAVLSAVIVAWAIVGINIKMRRLCCDGKER